MCQAKTSYIESEIEWGARFEPCMTLEKGSFRVDLRRFHTTYKVPLPNCSASQAHLVMSLTDSNVKDWGTWVEETAVEETQGGGHRAYTIDDIQEERVCEGNEDEGRAEKKLAMNTER